MKMRLGNTNGDRKDPPPFGMFPNYEEVKIFLRTKKYGLELALFGIFVSSSNACKPVRVCDFFRVFQEFGSNVLKDKSNSNNQVSTIKKILL